MKAVAMKAEAMKRGTLALVAASIATVLTVIAVIMSGAASSILSNQRNQSQTVMLKLYTLDPTQHDLKLINTQSKDGNTGYSISSKVVSKQGTNTIEVSIEEELGDLICLCATGKGSWSGNITSLTYSGSTLDGPGSLAKLSTDKEGYYPCWRFTVDSGNDRLIDEGHSDTCRLKKFELGLKTVAVSNDEFDFVNVMRYMYEEKETIGQIKGTVKKSVEMSNGLGDMICICATDDDAWSGYLTELRAPRYDDDRTEQVKLTGVSNQLIKLSTNDRGYFNCWRFDVNGWSTGSFSLSSLGGSDSCHIEDNHNIELSNIRGRIDTNRNSNFRYGSIMNFNAAANQMSAVSSRYSTINSRMSTSYARFNSYYSRANSDSSLIAQSKSLMYRCIISASSWRGLKSDTKSFTDQTKSFASRVATFAAIMKLVPYEMREVSQTVSWLAADVNRIAVDVKDIAHFGDELLDRVKKSMTYTIEIVDQLKQENKESNDKIAQLSEEIVALKEENRELSQKVAKIDDLIAIVTKLTQKKILLE